MRKTMLLVATALLLGIVAVHFGGRRGAALTRPGPLQPPSPDHQAAGQQLSRDHTTEPATSSLNGTATSTAGGAV